MVFCTKCGTQSADGKKFCFQCGTKLVQATPKPVAPVEEEQQSDAELLHWAQYQAAKKGYNIESWSLECFTDGDIKHFYY